MAVNQNSFSPSSIHFRGNDNDFQLQFLLEEMKNKERELQDSKTKVIDYLLSKVNTLSLELSIKQIKRPSSTACSENIPELSPEMEEEHGSAKKEVEELRSEVARLQKRESELEERISKLEGKQSPSRHLTLESHSSQKASFEPESLEICTPTPEEWDKSLCPGSQGNGRCSHLKSSFTGSFRRSKLRSEEVSLDETGVNDINNLSPDRDFWTLYKQRARQEAKGLLNNAEKGEEQHEKEAKCSETSILKIPPVIEIREIARAKRKSCKSITGLESFDLSAQSTVRVEEFINEPLKNPTQKRLLPSNSFHNTKEPSSSYLQAEMLKLKINRKMSNTTTRTDSRANKPKGVSPMTVLQKKINQRLQRGKAKISRFGSQKSILESGRGSPLKR